MLGGLASPLRTSAGFTGSQQSINGPTSLVRDSEICRILANVPSDHRQVAVSEKPLYAEWIHLQAEATEGEGPPEIVGRGLWN